MRAERARARDKGSERGASFFQTTKTVAERREPVSPGEIRARERERERFCDWLTKGTVEPIRGQAGSDDKDHAGHPDPAPALDATGAAAAERYRHEHEHDLVCAHTGNG